MTAKPAPAELTTYTGVPLSKINDAANELYRPHVEGKSPYEKIPKSAGSIMGGKTDIKFHYARERVDKLFGPHGVGWKLVPDPQVGGIFVNGSQVEYRGWVFWFCAINSDAGQIWISSSPMSDAHSNADLGYAHRGAFTSLMKQALRMLGGQDHIYDGLVDSEGDMIEDAQPPKSKPEAPAKPKGKPTSKTGLDSIDSGTPIGSANWDWLPQAKHDSFLEKYKGKTFGDLTDATRTWLVGLKPLPFEVAEYLK